MLFCRRSVTLPFTFYLLTFPLSLHYHSLYLLVLLFLPSSQPFSFIRVRQWRLSRQSLTVPAAQTANLAQPDCSIHQLCLQYVAREDATCSASLHIKLQQAKVPQVERGLEHKRNTGKLPGSKQFYFQSPHYEHLH